MKFEIDQNTSYGSTQDTFSLKLNGEEILKEKPKDRVLEVIKKVMEALL